MRSRVNGGSGGTLAFGVWRLAFGVWRLAFGLERDGYAARAQRLRYGGPSGFLAVLGRQGHARQTRPCGPQTCLALRPLSTSAPQPRIGAAAPIPHTRRFPPSEDLLQPAPQPGDTWEWLSANATPPPPRAHRKRCFPLPLPLPLPLPHALALALASRLVSCLPSLVFASHRLESTQLNSTQLDSF